MQLAKVIAADGVIKTKELKRIYEVMAAFRIGSDTRAEILDLLFFRQKKLLKITIDKEVLEDEDMRIALAKDVLFVEKQEQDAKTGKMAQSIVDKLGVASNQIDFLRDWVAWENKALRRLGAGELDLEDKGNIEELTSRAASVGIPLTALYFAGTTGFGAVGITSGLAALGGASGLALLGLNPMTAGIAGLIVAGISLNKLFGFMAKKKKRKQSNREIETAVQKAKDIQLRYRQFLIEDMNEFEKSSIRDWFTGKSGKRKLAIKSFRQLLSESLQEPSI